MKELGERASRRSIRREVLVLREKKYFDVRSQVYVKFLSPDLPSRVIEWRAVTILCMTLSIRRKITWTAIEINHIVVCYFMCTLSRKRT